MIRLDVFEYRARRLGPQQASYFHNTTRRDRHRTTRFLENKRHTRPDRHTTNIGKFLL